MNKELKVRELELSDKDEVVELTSDIWDGRDYIPDLYEEWVDDGGFICGIVDGDIIALAKHTWHNDDVLWLEGLRVHPDYHGKGYGRAMIESEMKYIEDLDYSAARFLTSNDNTPVKKVVEDLGFELKKAYDYLRLNDDDLEEIEPPSDREIQRVRQEKNIEEVIEFVMSSQEMKDNAGLYIEHWTAYPMDEELLEDRVENGYCYSVRDEGTGKIEALIFLQVHEEYGSLSATFACGEQGALEELFKFGIKECVSKGYDRYRLKTASDNVIKAAKNVGFSYSDHHDCTIVYEYRKD
ncbi:MAG: GNAT family N-acetyltransferase [Candidatus Saliniplasma sp.]